MDMEQMIRNNNLEISSNMFVWKNIAVLFFALVREKEED
jgi:hypothetical protein